MQHRIRSVLCLPFVFGRQGEGGLRRKGLYKKNLPGRPLVTIVTIVFNAVEQLEKTIQSVLEQDYDNVEYIVIDGGSTDGTLKLLKRYDDVIDYWVSEPDRGISDAFNKGISLATGQWLNFLNAGDCYVNRSVLGEVAAFFDGRDIITGVVLCGDERIPKRVMKNDDPLVEKSLIAHQASWVHRRVFENIGYFSLRFKIRMDYEFWLRALAVYDFEFVDKVLIDYDPNGISGSDMRKYYLEECIANRMNLPEWLVLNTIPLLKLVVKKVIFERPLTTAVSEGLHIIRSKEIS